MRTLIALTAFTVLLMAGTAVASDRFPDVSDDNVHHDNINTAAEQGIVQGHPDGTFRPRESVRRDQAASMFARYDERRQELLDAAIESAWTGPVYRLTPLFPEAGESVPCEFTVADHNNVGSGAASVEYSVDGSPPAPIRDDGGPAQAIPAEGFVTFQVDARGMVTVLVDGIAQAHAHTTADCTPAS